MLNVDNHEDDNRRLRFTKSQAVPDCARTFPKKGLGDPGPFSTIRFGTFVSGVAPLGCRWVKPALVLVVVATVAL